ncbi:Hypothetical predicted protein [Paramuricea clavata]|uniref:Uncharacterized protein n=1 Tax=Paramuricea clavata TaxID=317549 RepID=A0A6S7FRM6_PARCT|nr:Hypothetical predicted protein [Paramuricea clavata]
MVEVYKKYNTDLSAVLGQYGQAANATTKMIFVNRFKKIGLASGKMSVGSTQKFCCKTVVEISLEELEQVLEALPKCSKQPGSINYFELGESTTYTGDVLKLVLKGSEYGGLMLCKLKKVGLPDSFTIDDDNPDPAPLAESPVDELQEEWSECFEKFFISKNEDWSLFAKKLRDFWHDITTVWNDNGAEPATAEPPSTSTSVRTSPRKVPPTPAKPGKKAGKSSPVKRKQPASGGDKKITKKKKPTIVESDSEWSDEVSVISVDSDSDSDDCHMYFDTRNNTISPEQQRMYMREMMLSSEFKNAMENLVRKLKITHPEKFKKSKIIGTINT